MPSISKYPSNPLVCPNDSSAIACDAPESQSITNAMRRVLENKRELVKSALDNKWQRYNPILIGGDFFTVGYLAFQGVQALKPGVQHIAAVAAATLACGVIAGVINIGVGFVCLTEAIQALRNGDKVLGSRLMLDFICCTSIGSVMILASLAIKISALGGIGAFFATNPWFLPVLFFIITIPLLTELSYRIKNIQMAQDFGSKLKFNDLENLLRQNNWEGIKTLYSGEHPFNLESLKKCSINERPELISKKIEELQADMGVSAAVEVVNLLILIAEEKKDEALEQLKTAEKKIKEWNHSLYLRMCQQILYCIGFCISMAALSPQTSARLLDGVQSFFLVGANVIPLYMDTFWPFKRNTPIVVPKVEPHQIINT